MQSSVFDKLEYTYFNGDNLVIQKSDNSGTYNVVPSEDYNFCLKLKNAGYQVMLNTDLRLGNSVNLII